MIAADENSPLFNVSDARARVELHGRFGIAQAVNRLALADFNTQSDETLAGLTEDGIRDLFLAQLNAVFGATTATGETFRRKGKTDIRIGALDVSAFVGECKVWDGAEKTVNEALGQIFLYVTPSDRHCALLVFNKTTKPQTVVRNTLAALKKHPFVADLSVVVNDREWRVRISREGEPDVIVHVFIFDYRNK